jgi:hypothetical protein
LHPAERYYQILNIDNKCSENKNKKNLNIKIFNDV